MPSEKPAKGAGASTWWPLRAWRQHELRLPALTSPSAEVGEAREAVLLFAVSIFEERGAASSASCEQVGTRNVIEFNYRIADNRRSRISSSA
ncbi:hypothetical protein ACU4GD_29155 [Cupriavidus basilensis]